MTEATRRISEQNLRQRLALTGPDDELHRLPEGLAEVREDLLETNREAERLIHGLGLLQATVAAGEQHLSAAPMLVTAELAPQTKEEQADVEVTADRPLTVLGDPVHRAFHRGGPRNQGDGRTGPTGRPHRHRALPMTRPPSSWKGRAWRY
ncbi:hypothetical protein ACFYXF_00805 [Streptomyces sp. NPDC002680]|uniref:hypothetical protein n=1 Tax=Streptomyces sp. NPDC002680 TaxID=3364659 RepID=UPI00369C31B8